MSHQAPKAIALLSGGLDSLLAAGVVKNLGVEVLGVAFDSGFFHLVQPGSRLDHRGQVIPWVAHLEATARRLQIPLEIMDVSREFFQMLLAPAHGYGAHVNPCIDCKILFLKRARERLQAVQGDFLITGEVLGQRPMSQNRPALGVIERAAGCEDILLRPLSALCLPATRPEREGLVDRERLLGFSGRTRKPQMALAASLGIGEYSQPAGGCILTDEGFARRFLDFRQRLAPGETFSWVDIVRLRLGRHFRLPGGGKIIIGRNEKENDLLEAYQGDWACLQSMDYPGPIALVQENADPAAKAFALRAVARYADVPQGQSLSIAWHQGENHFQEQVEPLPDSELAAVRL